MIKDVNSTGYNKRRKWYNNYNFPLIPELHTKPKEKYNTSSFTFKWIFFTVWSLDTFSFEISIVSNSHFGIGFVGILPYLRWVATIPCPSFIDSFANSYLKRRADD